MGHKIEPMGLALDYDPRREIDWERARERVKAFRDRASASVADWGGAVLPLHFLAPPAPVHYRLGKAALDGGKVVAAVARDHAKSTLLNIGLVLFEFAHQRKSLALLIQRTPEAAGRWLVKLGNEVKRNPILRDLYGCREGSPWQEKEEINFEIAGRSVTVLARSIGGSVLGEHPDRVIFDDPQELKNCRSRVEREALSEWWKQTVLGARRRETQVVLSGTLKHPMSLVCEYAGNGRDREPKEGWDAVIASAIVSGDLDDPNCKVLWPERCPREFLLEMRIEMGHVLFERDYLQRDVPDGTAWMPIENLDEDGLWCDPIEPDDEAARELWTVMSIDPADSETDDSDNTALNVVGYGRGGARKGRYCWVDCERERWGPTDKIERALAMYAKWWPSFVVVEANRQTDFVAALAREGEERFGRRMPIETVHQTNLRSKGDRISALVPIFDRGRLLFSRALSDVAVTDVCGYPNVEFDDVPDGLATCVTWMENNRRLVDRPRATVERQPLFPDQSPDAPKPIAEFRKGVMYDTFSDLERREKMLDESGRERGQDEGVEPV